MGGGFGREGFGLELLRTATPTGPDSSANPKKKPIKKTTNSEMEVERAREREKGREDLEKGELGGVGSLLEDLGGGLEENRPPAHVRFDRHFCPPPTRPAPPWHSWSGGFKFTNDWEKGGRRRWEFEFEQEESRDEDSRIREMRQRLRLKLREPGFAAGLRCTAG